MATLLQHLDDLVLVLGEHLSETVGALDEIVLRGAGETSVDELLGVVDFGAERKHLASLLRNGNSVTCQHLDRNTKLLGLNDGLSGILTRRVEHGKHAEQNPVLVVLLVGDTERAETTASELGGLVPEQVRSLLRAGCQGQDGLWRALRTSEAVATERADSRNTLGHGVEGGEFLGLPVVLQNVTCFGVALERKNSDLVDGVERLDVVGRGQGSACHHPVDVLALSDVWLADRQLVGSEGTGLVRAENIDTSKRLDGGQLLHDGLLLREVSSTDGQCGSRDDRQTDRHADDEQNKNVAEKRVVGFLGSGDLEIAEEATYPGKQNPEHDQDEKRSTDAVHDGLEVTLVLCALDKHGSAADERVLRRGQADSTLR